MLSGQSEGPSILEIKREYSALVEIMNADRSHPMRLMSEEAAQGGHAVYPLRVNRRTLC